MFNDDYKTCRVLDGSIEKENVKEFIEEQYGVKANEEIDQTEKEIIQMIEDVSSYINELEANGIEEKVLKLKNPAISYYFAKFIVNASTNRHGKIIIESKDLYWNYKYALDIHTSNVSKHGEIILESNNKDFIAAFYITVPGINKAKFIKRLNEIEKEEEQQQRYEKIKKLEKMLDNKVSKK